MILFYGKKSRQKELKTGDTLDMEQGTSYGVPFLAAGPAIFPHMAGGSNSGTPYGVPF